MTKPLVVKYQGKRKEIKLFIEDCPDDIEIRTKLQDDSYETEWKKKRDTGTGVLSHYVRKYQPGRIDH